MFELAQQLTYYLSVVDGGASSKLVGWGQQLASIAMIAGTAKASIEQITAPIVAIANAWSGREQQINNISRSLRQYEYVGESIESMNRRINASMPGASESAKASEFTRQYQSQFNEARRFSRGIVSEMNRMAAILPGEMNDYMQSFSMNLPQLSRVNGMTIGRAAHLTSYLTAGGVAAGIDAGQSARDLMQALTTGAHIVDRSWTEVWSQYARYKGRRIDTAGFNRLRLEQKVGVLEDIARQLEPMMNATGDSYDALIGTFRSLRHELYLTATEPLFDAWKRVLSNANQQLAYFAPALGLIGMYFSKKLAVGVDHVAKSIGLLDKYVNAAVPHFLEIVRKGAMAYRFVGSVGHLAYSGIAGVGRYAQHTLGAHNIGVRNVAENFGIPLIASRVLGAAFGPVGMILGGILGRMVSHGLMAPTLGALFTGLTMVVPPIVNFALTLYRAYDALMNVVTVLVAGFLPPLIMLTSTILGPLLNAIAFVTSALLNAFMFPLIGAAIVLFPVFMALYTIIEISLAGWRMLASLFGALSGESFDVIDAMRQLSDGFQMVLHDLQTGLNDAMHDWGMISDEEYAATLATLNRPSPEMPQWMQDIRTALLSMSDQNVDLNRRGRGQNQPRPHSVQDFRYSRFDITQKFAEGFDPDRVASAMASDIVAMADQRLESGFRPAFTGQ